MAKARMLGGGRQGWATVALVLAAPLAAGGQAWAQADALGEAADTAPTFSRDIAPIFQRSCQHCHQPTGIAPMSLLSYRDARPWSRSIRDRVERRLMPPWHLDTTVGIQDFKNDISLTRDEIDTVVRWADAGAPEGNPADLPARSSSTGPTLGKWKRCSGDRQTSSCSRRPTRWWPTARTSGGSRR